ncbi:MAG: ferric reductase-like transmembrane domain-containing protein [Chloroflexi bacterium]|nr:ferric reductase-like transmembrane domain-containing protein [Chloroflexota bacterium]MCI0789071.1 ferric reductase-like transmembrane domain-containing protein [Chloroflexota bacterium]MCI0801591.1 ferric reductase-like transmembrane domain-containing protein [Chloroflexota bacterium]MCI0810256.1 ferric reductase-like transmembrane domain-containing protein [Chloroflexota bacterium]MCI0829202.1 ferric reductase-like transmembrane domain-containing protein [Chloroflexota bacterium]
MMLLYMALALGPAVRFMPRAGVFLRYRRELGIWFGIFAIAHTIIILDGWVLWDFYQFMGYQYIPAIDQTVRMESGFGMANILGLMAVLIALPLMATSTDWATRALGASAWKFIHYGSYTIFYAVALHTAYFLYIHYTMSFHRTVPDPNWFQIPFAVLTAALVAAQVGGFFKTVASHRRGARRA